MIGIVVMLFFALCAVALFMLYTLHERLQTMGRRLEALERDMSALRRARAAAPPDAHLAPAAACLLYTSPSPRD